MKQKLKSISGVTLVEILIGIVISGVMMAALYTSYNVVNNSYSQVSDKANISRTGRDIIGMLIRDIRMAGYFDIDSIKIASKAMYPIVINKSSTFSGNSRDCDEINIVYGDTDYVKDRVPEYTYPIYKIIYKCIRSNIPNTKKKKNAAGEYPLKDLFAVAKSKISWNVVDEQWNTDPASDGDDNTFKDEIIIDHVEDLIFNPIDKDGLIIKPAPSISQNQDRVYEIKSVDVSILLRSPDNFFKAKKDRTSISLSEELRSKKSNDRYLREAIVVTAHARNVGSLK